MIWVLEGSCTLHRVPEGIGGHCPRASYWYICISFQQLIMSFSFCQWYMAVCPRRTWSSIQRMNQIPITLKMLVKGLPMDASVYHSTNCSCSLSSIRGDRAVCQQSSFKRQAPESNSPLLPWHWSSQGIDNCSPRTFCQCFCLSFHQLMDGPVSYAWSLETNISVIET